MHNYNYSYIDLTDLEIPIDAYVFNCHNNNLTKLILPDTLKRLSCWSNNINVLSINDNLTFLSCDIFVRLYNINNKELVIKFW